MIDNAVNWSLEKLKHRLLPAQGGGILPEKSCGGVRPTTQNPYPIYDQNLRFLLPYLRPEQNFDTLFMTVVAGTGYPKHKLLTVLLTSMKK